MTCGIYKLNFRNTDKVYVGQSQNIEYRYTQHIGYLERGVNSKKLQEAYKTHGLPTLEIIRECILEELDDAENQAIEIFNAVDNGFNTLKEANSIPRLVGEKHPGAKYTNEAIEAAFLLLSEGILTHQQIADNTGVSKNMVNHIAAGTCHAWLSDIWHEKYSQLIANKPIAGTSKERGKIYPKVESPEGVEYTIDNLRGFAREHNIPYSSLNSLVNYRTNSVRGWKRIETIV